MTQVGMADVKLLIKMYGLTVDEVAKTCGISRRTAYRWLDSFTLERHKKMVDAIQKITGNQIEGGAEN